MVRDAGGLMDGRIERLERLGELREKGALSEAEFEEQKAKIIGTAPASAFRGHHGILISRVKSEPRQAELTAEFAPVTGEVPTAANKRGEYQLAKMSKLVKFGGWALLTCGTAVLLIKFGVTLAVLILLVGIIAHIYAGVNRSSHAKTLALISYGIVILTLSVVWVSTRLAPKPSTSDVSRYASSITEEQCVAYEVELSTNLCEANFISQSSGGGAKYDDVRPTILSKIDHLRTLPESQVCSKLEAMQSVFVGSGLNRALQSGGDRGMANINSQCGEGVQAAIRNNCSMRGYCRPTPELFDPSEQAELENLPQQEQAVVENIVNSCEASPSKYFCAKQFLRGATPAVVQRIRNALPRRYRP